MTVLLSRKRLLHWYIHRPITIGFVLVLIALLFRLNDIFVLELDVRWGEILLSKALGFGLVVLFVWGTGQSLRAIGLHDQRLGPSLLIGTLAAGIPLLLGYLVEYWGAASAGQQPVISLGAIDPKAGVTGGLLFALWLVAGNFVNSFMEEGLFRGVMIPLFRIRLSFWRANLLQAFLFGLWHLPWALRWYQTGQLQTSQELMAGILSNFLPQFLLGLVWGYLFLKTNSLWTSWSAHTLTNSTLNLLHVITADGTDTGMWSRMAVYTIAALLNLLVVRWLTARFHMPEVQPWHATENQGTH